MCENSGRHTQRTFPERSTQASEASKKDSLIWVTMGNSQENTQRSKDRTEPPEQYRPPSAGVVQQAVQTNVSYVVSSDLTVQPTLIRSKSHQVEQCLFGDSVKRT